MDMKEALARLIQRRDLSHNDMSALMRGIMAGQATPAQIAGFLIALRMKGESVDEITAAAEVMRSLATKLPLEPGLHDALVDTCGTGGDSSGLFNVSTASAIMVAAAGGRVAKHGNRSVSSRSGSADVLEAAGINLDISCEDVALCIRELRLGFMYAPAFHKAMKHAVGPRREMGVRTLFNLIGPLTNPAEAPNQLMGVFAMSWVEPMAEVLNKLGSQHVMVVHSEDGLDEISVAKPTRVAELCDGMLRAYNIDPDDYGLQHDDLDELRVDGALHSLELINQAFAGKPGAARDILRINAAAALYVAGVAGNLREGIERATAVLDDGSAAAKLSELARFTASLGTGNSATLA